MLAQKVKFIHMADGTAEDYRIIAAGIHRAADHLADDVLALLQATEANDMGYQVDRLEHSLQSATLAFRDGRDEETVISALLHDVGDTLAPWNHAEVAAAILKPYVSETTHWIVAKHALFQTYYYNHHFGRDRNARDRYRGHPHYQACADFCEKYDQNAFDPNFDTMPLSAFEPMVRRLFERAPNRDLAAHDA
jgi:predicted HD phosphohydrolase